MSSEGSNNKKMSIIVTKGTLDWGYPPFILAATAASLDVDVTLFFTFYGLQLMKKDVSKLQISTLGNPAMEMPMMGMHVKMPNIVSMLPGVDAMASNMMRNLTKKKGVASVGELREMCVESDVRMIGCQMTMDLFEWSPDMMIPEMELGGAAAYMSEALESDINLYI